jgi:hypothetical protein
MTGYAVARLEEIDEVTDGRCPFRPVRHHFGITSFGVNAWTARNVGDRIINEHDEADSDSNEELYLGTRSTKPASTPRRRIADADWSMLTRSIRDFSTTSPVARASRGRPSPRLTT